MSEKQKALLVGDQTDAPWHPLKPARQELEGVLGSHFQLVATEDYHEFAVLNRAEYPLCISYTDCWKRDLAPVQTAGLLQYVAGGGGLLAIHNGISLQRSSELAQMIGARFTGHPPYQPLHYFGAADHPVLEGVGNFRLEEEPYQFDFALFAEKTVFLEFEYEGSRYPAGWAHPYGLGRVVYLQPGHHAPSFQQVEYRGLLLNSAIWASGQSTT